MKFLSTLSYTVFALFAFFFSVLAIAADAVLPPETIEQVVGFIPGLIAAAQSSNWLAFGAGIALILTFVVKKYVLPSIGLGNGFLPWISLLIGALSGYGGAVMAGATSDAALMGLLSGPVASLIWDAIAQYIFPKPA